MFDLSEIQNGIELARSKSWVALAALLIGFAIRVLKDDRVPVPLPPRWRPALAAGFGLVAGAIHAVASDGAPLVSSLTWGVIAGVLAVVGHIYGIEVLRGGKEIAEPKGPGAAVLLLAGVLSLSQVGCAAVAKLLPEIAAVVSEASSKLNLIEAFVKEYFRAVPNPEWEERVLGAIGRARSALAAAEHATNGADKLTQAQTAEAFAAFNRAWDELERVVAGIRGLRLVRPGEPLDGLAPGDLVIARPEAAGQ